MMYTALLYTPDKEHSRYLVDFDLETLAEQVRSQARALGILQVSDLIAVTDGGNGLEEALQGHLADNLRMILDWYHAAKHICDFADRLQRLARKMLRDYPGVRRWDETDDVFQNACIRLRRALRDVKPTSVTAFIGLAATQIRRELIDLYRHHLGKQGHGRLHDSGAKIDQVPAAAQALEKGEIHELVEQLPEEQCQIVDFLFYQGLTQEEAANILDVSVPTVKRRWREARLALYNKLKTNQ